MGEAKETYIGLQMAVSFGYLDAQGNAALLDEVDRARALRRVSAASSSHSRAAARRPPLKSSTAAPPRVSSRLCPCCPCPRRVAVAVPSAADGDNENDHMTAVS